MRTESSLLTIDRGFGVKKEQRHTALLFSFYFRTLSFTFFKRRIEWSHLLADRIGTGQLREMSLEQGGVDRIESAAGDSGNFLVEVTGDREVRELSLDEGHVKNRDAPVAVGVTEDRVERDEAETILFGILLGGAADSADQGEVGELSVIIYVTERFGLDLCDRFGHGHTAQRGTAGKGGAIDLFDRIGDDDIPQ